MRYRYFLFLVLALILCHAPGVRAQNKLLTIDDIFDPVKKVNFNGTTPTVRWLKDGKHYLLTGATKGDAARIQKVDAATGQTVPFFNTAKMQAALTALGGVTEANAKQLSNRSTYQMSNDERAVLINWNNDLFYYQ